MKEYWKVPNILNAEKVIKYDNLLNKFGYGNKIQFSVYDCHNTLKWGGGRIMPLTIEPSKFADYIDALNLRNIPFYFTFSNYNIDVNDYDGNVVLKRFHNDLNGIIVTNDDFAQYVRDKYPKYKIVLSCTLYKRSIDYYLERIQLYDKMVLLSEFNYNIDAIKRIGPENLEVFVNEKCWHDCKFRSQHYKILGEMNSSPWDMTYNKMYDPIYNSEKHPLNSNCDNFHYKDTESLSPLEFLKLKKNLVMSIDHLKKLKDIGITHFKLSGRHRYHTIIFDINDFIFKRIGGVELEDSIFRAYILKYNWQNDKDSDYHKALKMISKEYLVI
jgi:collagenase-like PrtC family protease